MKYQIDQFYISVPPIDSSAWSQANTTWFADRLGLDLDDPFEEKFNLNRILIATLHFQF